MKQKISLIAFLLLASIAISFAQNRKLQKADQYFNSGEYTKALQLYTKLYSKAKTSSEKAEIAYKAGKAAQMLDLPNLVLNWYRNAIYYRYQDPKLYLYVARAYKYFGYYDFASDYLKQYLDIVPDDSAALAELQICSLAQKWLDKPPTRFKVQMLPRINSKFNDFAPAMSKIDTTVLYFTSMRPPAKGKNINPSSGSSFSDIFVASMDSKGFWNVPQPLEGDVNTQHDEGSIYISPDGLTMYFTKCENISNANMGCKIFVAYLKSGRWEIDHEVKLFADSSISVGQPWLTDDQLTMYFVTDAPNGCGGKDIWVTTRRNKSDQWGAPKPLGAPINTPEDELFPSLDLEGNLYFASRGHQNIGGFDIFKATKDQTGKWSIQNMKTPINSPANDYRIIFIDKNRGYLASNREYQYGDDIFYFWEKPLKIILNGIVYNDKTKFPVPSAKVQIESSDGRNFSLQTDADGKFKIQLAQNVDYFLITEKDDFLRSKYSITTRGIKNDTIINLELYIQPIDQIVKLPNIRYFFNDTTLRPESKVALDKLIELLTLNPNIKIEIMAHTDYRGSDEYNLRLSQGRANSVVKYLVDHGISPSRLVARGYGESRPFVVDRETARKYPFLKEGQKLTQQFIESLPSEQEQEICNELNRRTEFRVLGKITQYQRFGSETIQDTVNLK